MGQYSISLNICWYQDGDLIKVKVPNIEGVKVFPFSEFKFIGYTKPQPVAKQEEKKQGVTTLTCAADAWFGDIVVERNADGSLKSLVVSGQQSRLIHSTFLLRD